MVKGTAGQSGFVGVVCLTGRQVDVVGVATGQNWKGSKYAGDIVDVMTDGEIVELTGLAAGTKYYADPTGNGVNTTNTNPYVGHTVEAGRLIVRVAR